MIHYLDIVKAIEKKHAEDGGEPWTQHMRQEVTDVVNFTLNHVVRKMKTEIVTV